jgi:hypothetical protein
MLQRTLARVIPLLRRHQPQPRPDDEDSSAKLHSETRGGETQAMGDPALTQRVAWRSVIRGIL